MTTQSRWSSLFLIVIFALAINLTPSANANDDTYREGTAATKIAHKLGRGVVNVFTGWIEIPKNMAKRWRQYDPITGIVVGGVEGLFMGFGRTATGFYDVFTFPLAIPENYQPLMEPEFILPSIWGESLPMMDPVSGLKPLAP